MSNNQPLNAPNQADDYDAFANDFYTQSRNLMTWKFGGKLAFDKLLADFFGRSDVQVVDLGAASGRVEDYLISNGIAPENITAIEISPEQVALGKQHLPNVDFQVGDITNHPLDQGRYDLALTHMVFEHLDDVQLVAALQNAFGALKPGGTLAFVVTHPGKMTASDGVNEKGWFDTSAPWGGEVRNWFRSLEDFQHALAQAGFEVEVFEGVEVDPSAETEGAEQYAKYRSYGPIRLAVKAKKPLAA